MLFSLFIPLYFFDEKLILFCFSWSDTTTKIESSMWPVTTFPRLFQSVNAWCFVHCLARKLLIDIFIFIFTWDIWFFQTLLGFLCLKKVLKHVSTASVFTQSSLNSINSQKINTRKHSEWFYFLCGSLHILLLSLNWKNFI